MNACARRLALFILVAATAVGCGGDDDQGGTSAPAAPTELSVSTVSGGAHLTWKDNADDEESYVVERMAHPTGSWIVIATLPANSTQHHDAQGITSGAEYMYRVMAMAEDDAPSAYTAEIVWTAP